MVAAAPSHTDNPHAPCTARYTTRRCAEQLQPVEQLRRVAQIAAANCRNLRRCNGRRLRRRRRNSPFFELVAICARAGAASACSRRGWLVPSLLRHATGGNRQWDYPSWLPSWKNPPRTLPRQPHRRPVQAAAQLHNCASEGLIDWRACRETGLSGCPNPWQCAAMACYKLPAAPACVALGLLVLLAACADGLLMPQLLRSDNFGEKVTLCSSPVCWVSTQPVPRAWLTSARLESCTGHVWWTVVRPVS